MPTSYVSWRKVEEKNLKGRARDMEDKGQRRTSQGPEGEAGELSKLLKILAQRYLTVAMG